jgi:hypothetical protein
VTVTVRRLAGFVAGLLLAAGASSAAYLVNRSTEDTLIARECSSRHEVDCWWSGTARVDLNRERPWLFFTDGLNHELRPEALHLFRNEDHGRVVTITEYNGPVRVVTAAGEVRGREVRSPSPLGRLFIALAVAGFVASLALFASHPDVWRRVTGDALTSTAAPSRLQRFGAIAIAALAQPMLLFALGVGGWSIGRYFYYPLFFPFAPFIVGPIIGGVMTVAIAAWWGLGARRRLWVETSLAASFGMLLAPWISLLVYAAAFCPPDAYECPV